MQFKKIMTFLLASLLMVSPLLAEAKTHAHRTTAKAKISKKANTKKAVKKTASHSHATKAGNETKKLYGVKGAKLRPTKVSGNRHSYRVKGKTHSTMGKESSRQYSATGVASFYAAKFHGRRTANGETFDHNKYTAAHKTLAIGSYALVTNLKNGRKVIVRINDRGPFSKTRILDLSRAAAHELGMVHSGVANVRVEALQVDKDGYISGKGTESLIRLAKREGLSLKIRGEGKDLAVKAEENPRAKAVYFLKVTQVKTEKEAQKIARSIKQKTEIQPHGSTFNVLVHLADEQEAKRTKLQLERVSHYPIFSYSQK